MDMKICIKCLLEKSFTDFYRCGGNLLSSCKDCHRQYVRNRPNARFSARSSGSSIQIGRIRCADREYQRKRRKLNPVAKAEMNKVYREANPQKIKAHQILNSHLKSGRIAKCPCEICNIVPAQAHHPDYSRPLDVRWLCPSHHKLEHLKLVENL